MANTYPTDQFPLGSTEVKVLFNNASNFDDAMNSELPSFYDRFDLRRQTWAGMQKMVADFIEAFGFEAEHLTYVDGSPLIVSRPTQLIDRAGISYRIKTPATFPFTLTGTWASDLNDVVEVTEASFRADLASTSDVTRGAAIVGRGIQVVFDFTELRTLDKTSPSSTAFVSTARSIYQYDSTDNTSPDNGITVIVGADGGRWKTVVNGEISVKLFGAIGDGVADDTLACQAAIDFALPLGLRVYAPAGQYLISGTGLLVDNVSAGNTGGTQSISFRTGIRGDGQGSTVFVWGGGGQSCLKVITGGTSRSLFENFSLLQKGVSRVGYGLAVSQTSVAEFKNIAAEGFEYGCKADDNFTIVWNTCRFANNTIGFDASFIFVSRPNDFAFNNCTFQGNTTYGANFQNPTTLKFNGGAFEGNGDMIAGNGALRVNGNPVDGIAGLSADCVYFEGNGGSFDIGILDSATGGIHNITGCTFNRISSSKFTSANIALYKNNLTWRTIVRVAGNGFAGFGTYVPSATRRYVQVVAPVDGAYVMDLSGLNIWGVSTEIPDVPGAWANTKKVHAAVRFNGTTGVIDGISSNVASVVKNGTADYTINYAKGANNNKNIYACGMAEATCWTELFSESSAHLRFRTKNASGVYADFANISVIVYAEDGGI